MSTLREAMQKAASDAELWGRPGSWCDFFIQSMRESGYWIAPVDATREMLSADVLCVHKESSFAAMRDAYIKESGQ